MELTESIETINQRLIEYFGIDSITGQSIWRVVWSDDQYEKRLGTYDDFNGNIYLRTVTEIRLVSKYKQWIHQKFILERLVIVPNINIPELPSTKVSYEPLWTFEDSKGEYLPPTFAACKFIVDTVYAAQYSNHNLARYKDPDSSKEEALENKRKRIDVLVEELFGEQSSLGGSTVTGETIIVPRNYEKRGN